MSQRRPMADGGWRMDDNTRPTRRAFRSPLRPPLSALCLFCLLLLPACGKKSFKNANDELRAERQQLKQRVDELETELNARLGQIETMRAEMNHPDAQLAGADSPVLSSIKFGRYTGPVDTDADGRDDLVRLYVFTLDQRGRMLPVAARATLQAVRITEGQDPALYAERTYEPADLDAAYRTGLTGTHYTLELPLDSDAPDELTVKLTVTTPAGAEHTTQQAFRITR